MNMIGVKKASGGTGAMSSVADDACYLCVREYLCGRCAEGTLAVVHLGFPLIRD
jgi:hypothetical protein